MRTLLRTSLAVLAVTALATPARAADPVCTTVDSVNHDVAAPYCAVTDPSNDVIGFTTCIGVGGPDVNGRVTWAFTGGLMYGQYVASSTTYCWVGTARASYSVTGPVGFMVGEASGPTSEADDPICTQWALRFVPGNPHGKDPNTTYYTPIYCV